MPTDRFLKPRLMAMMFLQFFIWGAWYATGGNYMKSRGMTDIIYLAYLASPIGSIVAPFFLGMIADRLFPVQKVLGVMHVLSGLFVVAAPLVAEGPSASRSLFLAALLLHMLCYMPTVGLAMATAFHLLKSKEREFPLVRVFGTLGWIAAGILVSYLLQGDTTALPMYVAGAGGLVMGIYSFTLPNVPPPGAGKDFSFRDIAGLDALSELGSRPFVIFMLSVMLTSIPLATYFAYVPVFLRDAGIPNPAFKMTFGQMSEVVCLLALPWFFMQLGVKRVLIAGMLAWIVRCALRARRPGCGCVDARAFGVASMDRATTSSTWQDRSTSIARPHPESERRLRGCSSWQRMEWDRDWARSLPAGSSTRSCRRLRERRRWASGRRSGSSRSGSRRS
jgi:nucleoside transporter